MKSEMRAIVAVFASFECREFAQLELVTRSSQPRTRVLSKPISRRRYLLHQPKPKYTSQQLGALGSSFELSPISILRSPHDGMDGPPLPRLPPSAHTAREALYRDADDRRHHPWRSRTVARL